jgi:hypothetical protein
VTGKVLDEPAQFQDRGDDRGHLIIKMVQHRA